MTPGPVLLIKFLSAESDVLLRAYPLALRTEVKRFAYLITIVPSNSKSNCVVGIVEDVE